MKNIMQMLVNETTLWVPKLAGVILIIVLFYLISRLIKKIVIKTSARLMLDKHLTSLIARTSSIVINILGLITALGTLGIDVSALVAGLGLTGFALGFAVKDMVSNLFSGILILLYKPFVMGNQIVISGFEGVVVAIDLRYTELDNQGKKILIPNSKLFTDPITVIPPV